MKKVVFCLAFLFSAATAGTSLAQTEITGGVKAGASMTKFNMSGIGTSSDMGLGGQVGGFFQIGLGENFAIQPEILLNYNTSKWKASGNKETFKYWGLEIPVYAVGRFDAGSGKFFIGAGPYAGYGLSAKLAGTNLYKKHDGAAKADLSRFDFGAGAILGYEFANGVMINAGYQMGLIDNLKANKSEGTVKPRSVTLSVGFKF